MDRRSFLRAGLAAGAAASLGPSFWRSVLAAPGPLLGPDANGLMLPPGFTSRVVARANEPVPGTPLIWHTFPDGGATFPTDDGGWVYVSNSELPLTGGVSAIRFDNQAQVVDAYRILSGTSLNCAGGPTPWGRWLSCEEHDGGQVWECDPSGPGQGVARPALGVFKHEAAAVDPERHHVYLTEDQSDGLFYRFTPIAYPDLTIGTLEAMVLVDANHVIWAPVPSPTLPVTPTRRQVPGAAKFNGGEGCWYDNGTVYFTTKGDNNVWALDVVAQQLRLLYDANGPLNGVDNITVSKFGDIYVGEDGGNMEVVMITPEGVVAPVVRMTGSHQAGSEVAGMAFDPSGTRLYASSQRANSFGITYEITGPFATLGQP